MTLEYLFLEILQEVYLWKLYYLVRHLKKAHNKYCIAVTGASVIFPIYVVHHMKSVDNIQIFALTIIYSFENKYF